MKKFKKILLSALCLVLVVSLTIVGTVAFLQDEDGAINVMTVGNVHIDQLEQQFDENGELEAFKQNKLLYPVPELSHNNDAFLQATTTLAPEVNVVDKIVTVKNTGKSEAYLRTVFAIEMGAVDVDAFLSSVVLRVNTTDWTWTEIGKTYINGNYFYIVVAQYENDKAATADALAAKTTSPFSLGQVFLKASVGNEVCDIIDGNGNGTLDILTISQAVQTAGFTNATAALTAAFGEIDKNNHPWASNKADHVVSTVEQLQAALNVGGKITLATDVEVDAQYPLTVPAESVVTLDLAGNTISAASGNAIKNLGELTISDGIVKSETTYGVNNSGVLTVNNTTLSGLFNAGAATLNNVTIDNVISGKHAVYNSGSSLTINSGNYSSTAGNELIFSTSLGTATINGGTFNKIGKSYLMKNVVVNGGTFYGYVNDNGTVDTMRANEAVVNAGTFNFDPTNWAIGLVSDNKNGTWTVYPVIDKWDGTADISWYPAVATAAETDIDPVYYLYTAEHLAGLAELVNVYGIKFPNATIKLMVDVDLDNKAWTPIGNGNSFGGSDLDAIYATFDGNGKTISNLKVDVNAYAGLFGLSKYGIIKNVNVVNAEINSNHWAGVILGQGYAKVENCTVKNATVTATPELVNGEWDNGDKAGGIAGQITEGSAYYVKNCTVENVTVTAYRDLGGILGYANADISVIGNNAINTTVVINKEHDYKTDYTTDADYDANIIVGDARQSGVKVEDNKVNGNTFVSDAEDLKDLIESGEDIALGAGTYEFPASDLKEGQTIYCEEGVVFEGANSLNINGATVVGGTFSNTTGNAAGGTINGTFKDCVFTGKNALRYCYAGETVVFENCVFAGSTYGVHFDGGANEVIFKNCTFSGFNAIGSAVNKMVVDGCTFIDGPSSYNGINIGCNAEFKNTTFVFDGSASTEWVDVAKYAKNKTVSFDNCKVFDGENYKGVETVVNDFGENNTVIVNGNTVVKAEEGTSISDALQNSGDSVTVVVESGTHDLPSSVAGKDVTIVGTKDTVINVNTAFNAGSANLTFDGVTIQGTNENYKGIQHCGEIVYNNVTFNDAMFLYGSSVTFNNCTFNLTSNYIWTYDAAVTNFNNCTFNTTGKAVLVYHEDTSKSHTVNFTDCNFNASASAYTWDGQWVAAVEIDSSLCTNGTYTVNFYGENTADSNFNGLVRIKKSAGDNAVINYN